MSDKRWNRLLWGVMLSTTAGEMLIGNLWHAERATATPYGGEPTRAMLFCTRMQARAWCAAQMREWGMREDSLKKWKVRPVRVRETVALVD